MFLSIQNYKKNIQSTLLKDALYLCFLSFLVLAFLIINSDTSNTFFLNSFNCILLLFFINIAVYETWLKLLSNIKSPQPAFRIARISLTPILILLLLLPYHYFYNQMDNWQQLTCLSSICLGIRMLYKILTEAQPKLISSYKLLFIASSLYAIFFSVLSVTRYLNYQSVNTQDIGLYNQIQWNNLHGHFFESSTSGSNFVTHNSPFLILLTPFYAICPYPQGLLALKTFFLAFSSFPFFLITRHFLDERPALLLSLGYLFFPFIVGQNFSAPHEIIFLPPILLFCFYFFIKNKFKEFLIFLLLSLSIKEHLALVSIMFGFYALLLKKRKRWIYVPIVLGIAWALLSIWIMHYAQKIYSVDPAPAWLIEEIKRNFVHSNASVLINLINGFKSTNLGQWHNFYFIYLILSPLIIVFPFFSIIWLLGLPELLINLLAAHPLTYPTWHYSIVISCFLLISCAATIKKLSTKLHQKSAIFPLYKIQMLLACFLLICILSHFFLWSDNLIIKDNPLYTQTMNEVVLLIPPAASVSLPKNLAGYFSNRRNYFLLGDSRKGEYLIIDNAEDDSHPNQFKEIFNRNGIKVYKQIQP